MAHDWLRDLEAQGVALRLTGIGSDLVLVPSNRVEELSPETAAAAVQRALEADPRLAAEALRGVAELRGGAQGAGTSASGGGSARDVLSAIRGGLERGSLVALRVRSPEIITEAELRMLEEMRRKRSVPAPPRPEPPPPKEEPLHDYAIRVLDDTGEAVAGVRLKLEIEGTPKMPSTDATGLATTQWFSKAPASVRILDQSKIEAQLASQWESPPSATLPTGPNVHRLSVGRPFGELKAPADQETTIILCREASYVFEIIAYDGFGQPLAGLDLVLAVDGADQTVTTDDEGRARYEGASSDSAVARLADPDAVRNLLAQHAMSPPDEPDSEVIADATPMAIGAKESSLPIKSGTPTKIVLKRKVVRVRLIGMHFDHAKSFMLPSALEGIRKLNEIYAEHPNANLLVVGHTDTRHRQDSDDGGAKFNKELSLDRAKAVSAYLVNDVDEWYRWYGVAGERCWGTLEDVSMLSNVPNGEAPYCGEGDDPNAAMKRYQADQGLPTNEGVGERTRRALIRDYMDADGTTLPEGSTLTVHGCGPYFPDVESGPNDDVPENRRVEIFVFDGPIVPSPSGDYSEPGSPEYPVWVAQAGETVDFSTDLLAEYRLRLLGFDLAPVGVGTSCQIACEGRTIEATVSVGGIVTFQAAAGVTTVGVAWEITSESGGKLPVQRDGIEIIPQSSESTGHRLWNLGHVQTVLDGQVRSYQREMGYAETGIESDIAAEVRVWHDGGPRPTGARLAAATEDSRLTMAFGDGNGSPASDRKPLSSAPPVRTAATAAPTVRAELYKHVSGLAPGEIIEGTPKNLHILRVLKGSHSAVIFHGAKGLDIRPNNNDNAVPADPQVWVDEGARAAPRTICYYGRREPQHDAGEKHHSMFDVWADGKPTRSVFQVVVEEYPRHYVWIRLHGSVLALNDDDIALINHPYQMGVPTGPGQHDWSQSRLIREDTAEAMLNEALRVANQQPDGVLDHLVINAHGTMYPNGAGQIVCGGMIGGNFDSSNLDLWDRLKGKLRYLWAMNCDAGNDNHLFGSIAKKISDPAKGVRGWTTGMFGRTKIKPAWLPPNHVEYFVEPVPKHWDGYQTNFEDPVKRDLFFWNARHSRTPKLDRSALYFNIVARGQKLPGK